MGWPVVLVAQGGLAVSEAANGLGTPVSIAAHGFATPVTVVGSGGLPVVGSGGAVGSGTYPPADLTAWPDANNTGLPAGTALTTYADVDLNSTSDGQVIDKMHVTNGTIVINHNNVTVQRCKVDTLGTYCVRVMPGKTGALVRDCELINGQNGVFGAGTFLRNNIHNTENAITVSGGHNSLIKDNYCHTFFQGGADPHYDGVACQGGCNNIEVRHNYINIGSAQTTNMFFTDEFGIADNLKCINNYFIGSGYNIIVGGALTNVVIQDNLLGRGANGFFQTTTPAGNMTFSGNVSTTGIYLDGQVPPVVGTIAFQPTNPITGGSDANITTGFRVAAVLAQPIATEFRVVLYSGNQSMMGLDAVAFGKSTGTGQVATASLTPLLFGGAAAIGMPSIPLQRYVVSDWTVPGLSLPAGSTMLIGFNLRNPGGTGLASATTNANSYYGPTANMTVASPGYSTSAGSCYALARIETR